MDYDDNIHLKYLKYKNKYLRLKKVFDNIKSRKVDFQYGGGEDTVELMLFKAEWCGHCKNFLPVWNTLQKDYGNKYTFTTYDLDNDKEVFDKWEIKGYPTLIINNRGKLMDYNGPREMEDMIDLMNALEN